ncbi:MAG: PHP domain-containing protein [Oscillospiraceae bacterium]
MKNLFEMHVHSAEVSNCAVMKAAQVLSHYYESGYNGLVLTDHMNIYTFKNMKGSPWKKMIDHYLDGYHVMTALAPKDFTVLLGMEITFRANDNDYLVYGLDEDFLYNNENLMDMNIADFRHLADENNLLVFQAHPFRKDMTITNPYLLDGIEVYNGNSSHNSSNDIADLWADKYNLRKMSGSDFHFFWGMSPGGAYFKCPILNNSDLVRAIRDNDYTLRR